MFRKNVPFLSTFFTYQSSICLHCANILPCVCVCVLQGAKTKYANHEFDGISHHRAVLMAKELWPEHPDSVFEDNNPAGKPLETCV